MATSGVVSELYTDPDQRGSMPAAPAVQPPAPAAPPVPPAVQPVSARPRMADEGPDGRIRDTSGDALRPGNDLSFREFDRDPKEAPVEASAQPETPPAEVPAAPPAPVVEPKLYAGKFKSDADLEKGYQELERLSTKTAQELADLKRQATVTAAAPPVPPKPTLTEEQSNAEFLSKFVANPTKVLGEMQQQAIQQTQSALRAQEIATKWRESNPDIAEHEFFVTAETYRLSQSDPELAKDPVALLSRATDNFRQVAGKIRTAGAREALTTETRVIPLLQNTAPATASEQPSSKAPLSDDAAFDSHIRMLKAEERRSHQGLRR